MSVSPPQVLAGQGGRAGLAGDGIVRRGEVALRLSCDCIPGVDRSGRCHNSRGKAHDRETWGDAQITADHGRAGICDRRAAQDREAVCRSQNGWYCTVLQAENFQRQTGAFPDGRPASERARPGLSPKPIKPSADHMSLRR